MTQPYRLKFRNAKGAARARATARRLRAAAALIALAWLAGCSPAVGTEAWCRDMTAKPKGDWSANEAADFAKHCIFGRNDQG
jgi:hypothetical protein